MEKIQLISIVAMVVTGMIIPSSENVVLHVSIFVASVIVYVVTKIFIDDKNEP
jgi:hypothetical protein